MIVAIPVCEKDVALVLRNLEWCDRLGAPYSCEAIVSHDDGFDAAKVIEEAQKRFSKVSACKYWKWKGDSKWPVPQNHAWQNTARWIELNRSEPWLWWEADATPLKASWPDILRAEYEAGNHAFMGYLVDEHDGHMNGVGVYPAKISQYTVNGLLCRAAPFDIVMRDDVRKNVHRANHLFQWTPEAVSFPTVDSVKQLVRPDAVMFHKCKDGTLIDRLSEGFTKRAFRAIRKVISTPIVSKPLIPLSAHLDGASGYGTYSVQVVQELLKRSYRVECRSPSWHEKLGALPNEVKNTITKQALSHPWELIIYPCVIQPANMTFGKHEIAYLTMWESTRLISQCDPARTQAVNTLNRCKVVMVPNAWNASVFSSCGVETPIRLVPLGIPLKSFPVLPNEVEREIFVFGTAARFSGGGVRKGSNIVLEAFKLAFPKEKNVRLKVKGFADDPAMDNGGDPRIEIMQKYLTQKELCQWYETLNVFVSGSASEGWGRHQQEAMAVGRPVIGINFGGVTEFFNEENGYAVEWHLEPGEGIYRTMGHYAKPLVHSMADQMQRAYEDRITLNRKVGLAIASARRFSIEHSVDRMETVLREFKLL